MSQAKRLKKYSDYNIIEILLKIQFTKQSLLLMMVYDIESVIKNVNYHYHYDYHVMPLV